MNHAARRIGRSLALVLPVVLVLSGTLAVARVPWTSSPPESQMLTASAEKASSKAGSESQPSGKASKASPRAPQEVLRDRLLAELQEKNPGVALTSLQAEMARKPSLARHCASIARSLGRAAVAKYGASYRAHRYARPVCDTSFATGVAQAG